MKHKSLFILLGAEAAGLVTLLICVKPSLFSSLFAFPFEQIGAALRALSQSGRLGNGFALALWALISLLPLFFALMHRGEAGRAKENAALYILSVVLFAVLRGMANPTTLYKMMPALSAEALPVLKAMLGGAVWSLLVCWAVLCLLRVFSVGDTKSLLKYLKAMLYTLCAIFTGAIVSSYGQKLVSDVEAAINALEAAMAAIRFLVSALPYTLDIAITVSALALLSALFSDQREEAVKAAARLSKLCCSSLAAVTITNAAFNIFQLILAPELSTVNTSVDIPIMSLAFVLAALLLSRLIAENRQLRDDNELFI